MKIIPLVLVLLFNTLQSLCPTDIKTITIEEGIPIVTVEPLIIAYKPLIDAIDFHESGRNPRAYNAKEGATGRLQIRQCRIDHYNKLTGKNYTLDDMYDFNKSVEVFLYFCDHDNNGKPIPRKSFEVAARNWNGRWEKTEKYWENIKNILNS